MLALSLCLLFCLVFLCRPSVGAPAGHRADRTSQQQPCSLGTWFALLPDARFWVNLNFFSFLLLRFDFFVLSLCLFLLISGVGMYHGYAPGFIWLASDTGWCTYSTDCYSTVPLHTDTALRALMISYLCSFIETLFNLYC